VSYATEAAEILSKQHSIECTVINARFTKPLDHELLSNELPKYDLICTLEDHALAGGFGSAVVEFANDNNINLRSSIRRFGIGDSFVPHGSQAEQHKMHGYDATSITDYVKSHVASRRCVA
jgi:1-deoxy-D-xylulose-5-phosphate synthase